MRTIFKGIVKALHEFQQKLSENGVSIYVRRGGPNYQEGLRVMREVGQTLNIPIHVFGPETHMTAIVGMALNKRTIPKPSKPSMTTANFLLPSSTYDENGDAKVRHSSASSTTSAANNEVKARSVSREIGDYVSVSREDVVKPLFTDKTKSIVWGMQNKAVQAMLDFDHVCSRKQPSVVAMIYPFV